MSKYLKILLVVLLPYSVAWSQQESSLPRESEGVSLEDQSEQDSTLTRGNTKIWLDKGVSLEGYNKVMLFHIQDATNRKLSSDILDRLTSLIRIKLEGAGITVIQPGPPPLKQASRLNLLSPSMNLVVLVVDGYRQGWGQRLALFEQRSFIPSQKKS